MSEVAGELLSEAGMTNIPTWGRVTAEPHEFLVHLRRGRVRTSGHGQSCFKWPGDSVALLSTSVAKLVFSADQVTREKVGVEVSGLAVFRVAEPLLAYRLIQGDVGRLSEILRDMFVGATRRIVANLTLEECLTHRKERVAASLMDEIAPVLSGMGMPSDSTAQGWGVVIDTIEIQNVRVLSEEVFMRLQAPFRESLALEALRAKESVAEEQARMAVARQRAAEQAKRELQSEEESRVIAERAREIEASKHAAGLAKAALEDDIARAERRAEVERQRRARAFEVEIAEERRRQEVTLEAARSAALAAREQAQIELETRREAGELEASLVRLAREQRSELSERQLEELVMVETLPRMAEAFRGTFGEVHLTSGAGGAGELFAFLSAGVEQVGRAARRASASARGREPQG